MNTPSTELAAPERKQRGRRRLTPAEAMANAASRDAAVRDAIANFDRLPDDAHLRAAAVALLLGIAIPTLWRWSREGRGRLPKSRKIGPNVTAWRVGDLRQALRAAA